VFGKVKDFFLGLRSAGVFARGRRASPPGGEKRVKTAHQQDKHRPRNVKKQFSCAWLACRTFVTTACAGRPTAAVKKRRTSRTNIVHATPNKTIFVRLARLPNFR